MKYSKRQGFSWDQEFKPYVDILRSELKGFSSSGTEPSSAEIFMLCLALGFSSGTAREVPARKTDGPRLSFFQPEQIAVVKAVALADSDSSDILVDEEAVYDIVEKYAAGGLMLLAKAHDSNNNFRDWLRTKLVEYSRQEQKTP